MSDLDLLIRGDARDVAVADGRIVAVGPELPGPAREELDARGLLVLPGVVDAHVHLNDPGRADWEGFATGTAALAAGGTTCAIDMPLNAIPPTIDGAAFDAKVAAATGVARIDVALWGGLVPGDLDRLDELAARGVVGFKAFMSASSSSRSRSPGTRPPHRATSIRATPAAAATLASKAAPSTVGGCALSGISAQAVAPPAASAASATTPPRRSGRPTSRWRSTCSSTSSGTSRDRPDRPRR